MRAVILAGGRGERLAGEPKAFLPFSGVPLIALVVRLVRAALECRPIVITDCRGLELSDILRGEAMVFDTFGAGTREAALMGLALAGRDRQPVLLMHGDVLCVPRILYDLPEDAAVVLHPPEAGKVSAHVVDGLVLGLGCGTWQYGGILALSSDSVPVAVEALARGQGEYWDALRPLFSLREIAAWPCSHEDLVDIDTAADSLRAHRDLWPRIKSYAH